jgi:hypothetical protein
VDDYQATSGADAPPGEKEYQRNRDEKPQTAGVHNQHKVDSPFDRQDAFVLAEHILSASPAVGTPPIFAHIVATIVGHFAFFLSQNRL